MQGAFEIQNVFWSGFEIVIVLVSFGVKFLKVLSGVLLTLQWFWWAWNDCAVVFNGPVQIDDFMVACLGYPIMKTWTKPLAMWFYSSRGTQGRC